MKINVNDKVLIASDDALFAPCKGKVATVKRIYTEVNPPIAFVEIEEDPAVANTVGLKVPLADLVLIPAEPKSEIPEGAREITKADFDAAVDAVTDPNNLPEGVAPSTTRIITLLGNKILGEDVRKDIFKDRDSVIMTEEEFTAALWNGCRPEVVANAAGNKTAWRGYAHASIGLMLSFEDMIPIFFGESEK